MILVYLPLAGVAFALAWASWKLGWLVTPIVLFLVGAYFLGQL